MKKVIFILFFILTNLLVFGEDTVTIKDLKKEIDFLKKELKFVDKMSERTLSSIDTSINVLNLGIAISGVLVGVLIALGGYTFNQFNKRLKAKAKSIQSIRKQIETLDLKKKLFDAYEKLSDELYEKYEKIKIVEWSGKADLEVELKNKLKRFLLAFEVLNLIREKDIQLTEKTYFALGVASYNDADYEVAIKMFNEVIKINPNNHFAFSKKAIALVDLKKNKEALKCLDNAIKVEPKFAIAFYNKGVILKRIGKTKEAIQNYEKAISINSEYFQAYLNKGIIYMERRKYNKALKSYKKALDINKVHANTYYNIACSNAKLEEKESMLQYLQKAINLKPELRFTARSDSDFDFYKNDPDFKKVIA